MLGVVAVDRNLPHSRSAEARLPVRFSAAMRSLSIALIALNTLMFVGDPVSAQRQPDRPSVETLEQFHYQFQYQSAADALTLVRDLLSDRGRVELQSENNMLVVVDSKSQISTIGHLLREFDHPPRQVRLLIQILRASRSKTGTAASSPSGDPTAQLAAKLERLMPYNHYEVMAYTAIDALEGRKVSYELGADYVVQFDVGTIVQGQRLKLRDFKVLKRVEDETSRLYNSHVNLWLERTLALGFARNEESETSLVVAITCSDPGARKATR